MLDRWFFAIYYRIVAAVQLLTGQIVRYWPGNWFGCTTSARRVSWQQLRTV